MLPVCGIRALIRKFGLMPHLLAHRPLAMCAHFRFDENVRAAGSDKSAVRLVAHSSNNSECPNYGPINRCVDLLVGYSDELVSLAMFIAQTYLKISNSPLNTLSMAVASNSFILPLFIILLNAILPSLLLPFTFASNSPNILSSARI